MNKFFVSAALFFIISIQCRIYTFAQTENEIYVGLKLEILCKTIRFMVGENNNQNALKAIDCNSLESIEATIPNDFVKTARFFKIFKGLRYESYGKGKLIARLDKLIYDINTELNKINRENQWLENVKVLLIELKNTKEEALDKIRNTNRLKEDESDKPKLGPENTANNQRNTIIQETPKNEQNMPIYVILLFLLLLGGIVFLAWQNQQLKKELEEIEDEFLEKYSRIDNRIDTMTPIREFQSVMLKFNFINDQLNALIQEVVVLKDRNENKIKPEELLAKRTEHLESYTFNPDVQIYYTKIRPEEQGFLQQEFKTEPSRDNIYKVEINLQDPEQAIYAIVDRNEYHQIALAHADTMLAPACDYANHPNNAYRIVMIEPGLIEKKDNYWLILKKAKISFE